MAPPQTGGGETIPSPGEMASFGGGLRALTMGGSIDRPDISGYTGLGPGGERPTGGEKNPTFLPYGDGERPQWAPYEPGNLWSSPGPNSGDPFGYTLGSLLTPWSHPFTPPAGSSGGNYVVPGQVEQPPLFQYGDFTYDPYRPAEAFATPDPFEYEKFRPTPGFQSPGDFTSPGDFSYGPFTTNFNGPQNFSYGGFQAPVGAPREFQALPQFRTTVDRPEGYKLGTDDFLQLSRFHAPDRFSGRGMEFNAPDANSMTVDPSYRFRLAEGQQALENSASARGTLLTGGTAKAIQDYGQRAAAQEYGALFERQRALNEMRYGRASGEHDRTYGEMFGEHRDLNEQLGAEYGSRVGQKRFAYETGRTAGTEQYGRETSEYDRRQQQKEQEYQSALDVNNLVYGRGIGEYTMGRGNALQENEMAYGRESDAYARALQRYQMGYGNERDINELRYGRASNEYDRTYGNRLRENELTYNRAWQEQGRGYDQGMQAYQTNFQVPWTVYQGNEANAREASNMVFGQGHTAYGTNYQVAQDNYARQVEAAQRAQAAQNAAAAAANAGSSQDYNRALREYQMAMGLFQTNQDRQADFLFRATGVGQNTAGQMTNAYGNWANQGGNFANMGSEAIYSGGNARASGQVAAGNAWQQGLSQTGQNLAQMAAYGLLDRYR